MTLKNGIYFGQKNKIYPNCFKVLKWATTKKLTIIEIIIKYAEKIIFITISINIASIYKRLFPKAKVVK